MNWQTHPLLLIPLSSAILAAFLCWFGWQRRSSPGAAAFSLAMLAVMVWSLGNALELGANNLALKVFWLQFEYIGILLLPAAWLVFALQFTGHGHWVSRRLLLLLAVEPILIFSLFLTSQFHTLYLDLGVRPGLAIPLEWEISRGLFFWINIAYSYCLFLLGGILLLVFLSRANGKAGGGELAIVAGVLLPWAANALSGLRMLPALSDLDLTPAALSLTGLMFAWTLFRLRLLEVQPALADFPAELAGWRMRVLDGILRGIFIIWLIALAGGINNVVDVYQGLRHHYSSPQLSALLVISIFVTTTALLAFITFHRGLRYEVRAGLFLFILYVLGMVGLHNAALSGDGRMFFFALVVLTAILFDLAAGLVMLACVLLTYVAIGWLQVTEQILVPLELQANATDPAAWLSGAVVFLVLSIAVLTSASYLLHALGRSLEATRESLNREQRLGLALRTLSNINQLIVREQDATRLLQQACSELQSTLGYDFAWIGLLQADGVTLKMAAQAGEDLDPACFTTRLDNEAEGLACAILALQKQSPIEVFASQQDNLCPRCPRLAHHPRRTATALPLVREGCPLGVLVVDHSNPKGHFLPEEIKLLSELADDIGYALEKIRADQRLQFHVRHQTLLADLTRASLETSSLADMLADMAGRLREAFSADGCYLTGWDAGGTLPQPVAASGPLGTTFMQMRADAGELPGAGIPGEQEPILALEDARSDQRVPAGFTEMLAVRSLLAAPLAANGVNLGSLFLAFRERHSFPPEEIASLRQAASQVALALAKTRLDEETRAHAVELEQLYAKIKQSEAYFRALSENSAEGVALIDKDGKFTYITPTEEKILGYDPGQVIGFHAFEIVHPEDLPRAIAALRRCMEQPDSLTLVDYRARHADGSWRRLEVSLKNLLHEPSMRGVVANFRDITERTQAAEALSRSEAYFRALVENAAEGVAILDAEGNFAYIVHKEQSLTGYTYEETIGRSVFRHIHPDDLPGLLQAFQDGVRTPNAIITREYRLQRKDGSWGHYEVTGHNLLHDPHIAGIVINYRDITERKHAEQAVEQHAADLAQAYDNTLAGWARALELRDELTEGHTRRVTELTLDLARALNVSGEELSHIRRGALLHDIGKMGIPDSILRKPGSLTAEEQRIMQLHPQYAFEMLSLIPFLRPALDIPYCHHERWDGNGYPRGLKSEQIPLAARIFSVVDVWDALTSDRPYRKAWSRNKARKYLLSKAGTHFDPQIVEFFLQMIEKADY
ncbi:MAG: histidine kinase N-terminal 7TM domain-containing protein [Chloroflexota bacterium]